MKYFTISSCSVSECINFSCNISVLPRLPLRCLCRHPLVNSSVITITMVLRTRGGGRGWGGLRGSGIKSLSTRGPGRHDTCHPTDFFQTFTVNESQ